MVCAVDPVRVRGFANSRMVWPGLKSNGVVWPFPDIEPAAFRTMSLSPETDYVPGQPGARFDPYVRLLRALLPHTSCIAMFGPSGELLWSTDTVTRPELIDIADEALLSARSNPASPGQHRLLAGNLPAYLCSLRDDAQQLIALVAITCRPGEHDRTHDFSSAYALLAPAIECLRRNLVARSTIDELNEIEAGLDEDWNLLLAQDSAEQVANADGAGELQQLLQQTIEHLHASTGALLVPEKNVSLVRADGQAPPD